MRQGCTLSLCLFDVLLDTVVNEAREGFIHGRSEIGEGECGCPTFCQQHGADCTQCRVLANEFEEVR